MYSTKTTLFHFIKDLY